MAVDAMSRYADFYVETGGRQLDKMMFKRVAGAGTARGNLDLAVNDNQVSIDRARTDYKLPCDLCIGQPLGYKEEYLELTRRQAIGTGSYLIPGR